MLPTEFAYLVTSLCLASFLSSSLALCYLHSHQIKTLFNIKRPFRKHATSPTTRTSKTFNVFQLNLMPSNPHPSTQRVSSRLTDRLPPMQPPTSSPTTHHRRAATAPPTALTAGSDRTIFTPSVFKSSNLLTVLALCDQIANIFLGIAVIRWYARNTETPRLFPSSPFTDPYASFCIAWALCARPLIILSVSFLELLRMPFRYEPNLGSAHWRLHITILFGAATIAGLTTFLSTQRRAPCLFLLAALSTMCVCTTIILAILLAVVWGCPQEEGPCNRVTKPNNKDSSFVVHGVTAVTSVTNDFCLQQPRSPLNRNLTTILTNGNRAQDHEAAQQALEQGSLDTNHASSFAKKPHADDQTSNRSVARANTEAFNLHGRTVSTTEVDARLRSHQNHGPSHAAAAVSSTIADFTFAARGHRRSASLHHRKPSQPQTVAQVYGDTYFKDETTKVGEWKSTDAERHSLDFSPPESASEHIAHTTDDVTSTDHFEFSTPRDMSPDEARSPTSQYSQFSASARKVRPLSTLSIFSELTAESQLEADTGPTARSLRLSENRGCLGPGSPLSTNRSLALQSNATPQTMQASPERLRGAPREQVTFQMPADQEQSCIPGTYTEELSWSGGSESTQWKAAQKSRRRAHAIAVTLGMVGCVVTIWTKLILSMPYLLHPISRGGNEEVTHLLPLLLVVGIAVAGILHLFQVVVAGHEALTLNEDVQIDGTSADSTFQARSPPGGDSGSSGGVSSPSVPGAYHSDYHTSPSRGAQAGQDASQHSPEQPSSRFSRSHWESSHTDLSVASVPYSSKHWRAGQVSGDQVVRPRGAVRRAANLLEPKPKLEVLPARGNKGRLSRPRVFASRRNAQRVMRTLPDLGRRRKSKAVNTRIARWDDELSESVASLNSSQSFGSPGAGRNCSAHDARNTLWSDSHAQTLTRDLDLDPSIADSVQQKHGKSSEHFCEDSLYSLSRPQEDPNRFILDGLSAMLLPHIAPGLVIGHDIEVAQDAQKEYMREYEDYQLRAAQSGEILPLSEDNTTCRKADGNRFHTTMHNSVKTATPAVTSLRPLSSVAMSGDEEPSRDECSGSGLGQHMQTQPLHLSPALRHQRVSTKTAVDQEQAEYQAVSGPCKSFSYQQPSSACGEAAGMTAKTMREQRLQKERVNNAIERVEGSPFSQSRNNLLKKTSGKPKSSLSRTARTGFPTKQLSQYFVAYEDQIPGNRPFKRVNTDAERMGTNISSLPQSDGEVDAVKTAISDQDLSKASSTTSVQVNQTGDAADLDSLLPANSAPVSVSRDRDSFPTMQSSKAFEATDRTPPKEALPCVPVTPDTQHLNAHVAKAPQSPFTTLTGSIRPLSASTPPSNLCSGPLERRKTWDRLPEPITPHKGDDSIAREEAGSPAGRLSALSMRPHRLSPDDIQHDCSMNESLRSEQSMREPREEHCMPQGAEVIQENRQMQDRRENLLTSLNKPLSPTVLAALTQSTFESEHSQYRPALITRSTERVAAVQQASLLSPDLNSTDEHREFLRTSLGMDSDCDIRHRATFSSSVSATNSSELLHVSQSDVCRSPISPSVTSSTSKRKSLVSEFGLPDANESCDDRLLEHDSLSNDIRPHVQGQQIDNVVPKVTPTGDKRSTGGTITTSDSSLLSSELVLSPVGSVISQDLLSPERVNAPNSLSQPPESPLKRLARRHGCSGSMELEIASRDSNAPESDSEQVLSLRDLSLLDYHMYINPGLNGRLPTLTEVTEEASQSTCGFSSDAHLSSRRDDSARGVLDRNFGDLYHRGGGDFGNARGTTADLSPSRSDRRVVRDGEVGHHVTTAAVQTISELRSPTGSVRSPGWLHVIDRQTSIMTVKSRVSTIGKERNGSDCSRATFTASTPQRIIGLRSEFWSVRNQPLPPLPFDVVTVMANSSLQLSPKPDPAGDNTTSEDEPDGVHCVSQTVRGESDCLWTVHCPDSDVWSQVSEAEFVAQLNERERSSAEHVRNTPQRNNNHRVSQRYKETEAERRKSSATLLKGRRSMSSLLGISKTSSTFETRANTSLPEMTSRSRHPGTLDEGSVGAETISFRSSQSAQWLFVNNSGTASSTSFVVPGDMQETASETVMLEAELERLLRRDAKRLTTGELQQERQGEAIMSHHTAERSLSAPMNSHTERCIKRIPAGRLAPHNIVTQPSQPSVAPLASDDDEYRTFHPVNQNQGNSIDSLSMGLCTVPADYTLQAISDSSVTASDLSRGPSATSTRDPLKTLFLSQSPKKPTRPLPEPQPGKEAFSTAVKVAAPTEWPASTPARAQHLSQLPEIEGAFRALMSLSPNVTESQSIESKKRWPRLSDAHLASSSVSDKALLERSSQSSTAGQEDHHACSPHLRNARPGGPRSLRRFKEISGEMDENANPF